MLFRYLATLGPIGYLPAPGTCGTVATIILLYYSSYFQLNCYQQCTVITVLAAFSFIIVYYVLKKMNHKSDPSEIVLDELVGTCITFFCVPYALTNLAIGFILFRFFDIIKPFGIKKVERFPHVWGVMLDDIVAGIVSCGLLHIILSTLPLKQLQLCSNLLAVL
jgi:phosphatidylglycerophosphatase A